MKNRFLTKFTWCREIMRIFVTHIARPQSDKSPRLRSLGPGKFTEFKKGRRYWLMPCKRQVLLLDWSIVERAVLSKVEDEKL